MIFILQALYAAFGIGLTVLDFYIYQAFIPDIHHSVYIDISTATDKAEGIGILAALVLGLVIEANEKQDVNLKACLHISAVILYVALSLESLARILSMTIVSIHVHPGKIDFLGLFVVMVLCYFVLKFAIIIQHMSGLLDRINSIKASPAEFVQIQQDNTYFECEMINYSSTNMPI